MGLNEAGNHDYCCVAEGGHACLKPPEVWPDPRFRSGFCARHKVAPCRMCEEVVPRGADSDVDGFLQHLCDACSAAQKEIVRITAIPKLGAAMLRRIADLIDPPTPPEGDA